MGSGNSGRLPGGGAVVDDLAAEAEGSRAVFTQGLVGESLVQTKTVLSYKGYQNKFKKSIVQYTYL